ncbi:MAG TPA: hypothetical protein VFI34_10890, partial [Candidatus Limnocylindrales bacterium]|nr:hypothetical protein [Candidatus Limnocylindrales bacterium]
LAAAIQRSATAFDVPPGAIAPLIRLAWLARGLKEVNRLRPDELDRGHHGRLVRLTLDRPGRGWAQLTGEESPAAR